MTDEIEATPEILEQYRDIDRENCTFPGTAYEVEIDNSVSHYVLALDQAEALVCLKALTPEWAEFDDPVTVTPLTLEDLKRLRFLPDLDGSKRVPMLWEFNRVGETVDDELDEAISIASSEY